MNRRIGYGAAEPLSIGAILEDALALVWRVRNRIAPFIILLTIGSAYIDFNEPALPKSPMDVLKTTSALHASGVLGGLQSHFFAISLFWSLCSLFIIIFVTKMYYAAYCDEETSEQKQTVAFVPVLRSCLRLIAVSICYIVLFFLAVIPLALLCAAFYMLTSSLGDIGQIAAFTLVPILLVIAILYVSVAIVTAQYLSVGAIISANGFPSLFRGMVQVFLLPTQIRRSFALGGICIGVILLLSLVCELIAHVLSTLLHGKGAFVIGDICSNLTITPILSAFGVVVYTDAMKRLELQQIDE